MKDYNTVSLCMIVKNEERYIAQCLHSVKDIVSEIIIVDTGSTDQTLIICEDYGARIYPYEWNEDFSLARNYSLSNATCNWILVLDADEILDPNCVEDLHSLLNQTMQDGYIVTIYNYTGNLEDNTYSMHHAIRLFRNDKGYCYEGTIHEQIVCSQGTDIDYDNQLFEVSNLVIRHYGYLDEVIEEKKKRTRNIPLLQKQLKAQPQNAFVLFNLGNEYLSMNQIVKATEYYQLSKTKIDQQSAFAPYLYYRMILCYSYLNCHRECIQLSDEILSLYPNFIDILYLKGIALYHLQQYNQAILVLDQCLAIESPPILLSFEEGTNTYKPCLVKAEIYKNMNDLESVSECLRLAYQYIKK